VADDSGVLQLAVTGEDGTISISSSAAPGAWSSWFELSGAPTEGFDIGTAPVLARAGTQLGAFARGADENLYIASKSPSSGWTSWKVATTDASVTGRVAADLTGASEAHVLYSTSSGCRYVRFLDAIPVATMDWPGCLDGTLSAFGSDTIGFALRFTDHLEFGLAERTANWAILDSQTVDTDAYEIYEISELVMFEDAYHVVIDYGAPYNDVKPDYVYQVRHLTVGISTPLVRSRRIDSYVPTETCMRSQH
jgi:hypothetical protein